MLWRTVLESRRRLPRFTPTWHTVRSGPMIWQLKYVKSPLSSRRFPSSRANHDCSRWLRLLWWFQLAITSPSTQHFGVILRSNDPRKILESVITGYRQTYCRRGLSGFQASHSAIHPYVIRLSTVTADSAELQSVRTRLTAVPHVRQVKLWGSSRCRLVH